jgi:coproporphyrinogen III oxidase
METKHPEVANWFKDLQDAICDALELADRKGTFQEDRWDRPGGGGGRTRVMKEGFVIEKGGVNFSEVYGRTPESVKESMQTQEEEFYATGVSIVLHPHNPWVPIIHMNVRMFEMSGGTLWFGGGIDLTPHLIIPEDAAWFHAELKKACDLHEASYYPTFKKWADDYFYIPHRKETRGIGGIFFDYLKPEKDKTFEDFWAFVQEIGSSFAPIYTELMKRNRHHDFSEEDKEWQLLRRGRYAEFNLVWDRGTKFGLQTDGRIESILMSMPPLAEWQYNHQPAENTPAHFTLQHLVKDFDWLSY